MVDVMGAVSTTAAIKAKAAVDFADSQSLSMRTPPSLGITDLFSGILGNFSASAEILRGETSFTMDVGTLDC